MLNEGANHQLAAPNASAYANLDDSFLSLSRLLATLAEKLDHADGPPIDRGPWPEPPPDRWEDDAYRYLEMIVPGWGSSEVDVTVTNGRAFIRVGR